MNKILIIGQALPAAKQAVPYDTTMLYEMLGWVNISKARAQEMFDFDALCDTFIGRYENGSHIPPRKAEIQEHLSVLVKKIKLTDKVILLGRKALDYFKPFEGDYQIQGKFLYLPHPSRRNYNVVMKNRELIINLLNEFLLSE